MKRMMKTLLKRFAYKPLTKEQADILASVKFPCC
ncbi:hypothetical protein C8N36_11743 [Pelagimonas varians]|uniref:Uncharacterized protein n=1 Tax=Pelagimonas varians TaxID=696760 RepID=A0A238L0Y2_9RHOB|nr:hypothetical protein C8N36_11743 [Pelagimonas varians]SMX48745.1 hypothetical protein PEV8663_03938 [Pelagimonas varians]